MRAGPQDVQMGEKGHRGSLGDGWSQPKSKKKKTQAAASDGEAPRTIPVAISAEGERCVDRQTGKNENEKLAHKVEKSEVRAATRRRRTEEMGTTREDIEERGEAQSKTSSSQPTFDAGDGQSSAVLMDSPRMDVGGGGPRKDYSVVSSISAPSGDLGHRRTSSAGHPRASAPRHPVSTSPQLSHGQADHATRSVLGNPASCRVEVVCFGQVRVDCNALALWQMKLMCKKSVGKKSSCARDGQKK